MSKFKESFVTEAEEIIVAWVDAGVADDVQECAEAWKAEFERLVEVGFRRYVTIDGMPGRVA